MEQETPRAAEPRGLPAPQRLLSLPAAEDLSRENYGTLFVVCAPPERARAAAGQRRLSWARAVQAVGELAEGFLVSEEEEAARTPPLPFPSVPPTAHATLRHGRTSCGSSYTRTTPTAPRSSTSTASTAAISPRPPPRPRALAPTADSPPTMWEWRSSVRCTPGDSIWRVLSAQSLSS